jgi:hypothetical protein
MMLVVTEALSEASLAPAGSLITRPEILARALLAGGTEAQREHWLPRIAAGDPLCAIAITEPDFGSDVASLALRRHARRRRLAPRRREDLVHVRRQGRLLMVVARTNPGSGRRAIAGSASCWSRSRRATATRSSSCSRAAAASSAPRSRRSAIAACTRSTSRSTASSCPTRTWSAAKAARQGLLLHDGRHDGRAACRPRRAPAA